MILGLWLRITLQKGGQFCTMQAITDFQLTAFLFLMIGWMPVRIPPAWLSITVIRTGCQLASSRSVGQASMGIGRRYKTQKQHQEQRQPQGSPQQCPDWISGAKIHYQFEC